MRMGRIRLMLADDEAPVIEAMRELVSTVRSSTSWGPHATRGRRSISPSSISPMWHCSTSGCPAAAAAAPPERSAFDPRDRDRRSVGEHGPEDRRVDGPGGGRGVRGEGSVGR